MKKYDIGIQTLWNVPNYGTFVQAYSLQKVIKKISGKETVQIAHLDEKHYNFYYNYKKYLRSKKIFSKEFVKSFFYKNPDVSGKLKIFSKAYNIIPHTDIINIKNLNNFQFNKVFLGSDILWDYSLEPFNKDRFLFGTNFNAEINSYAASFGTIPLGDKYPEYVINGLKNMKNISVRDEKSALIVEDILGYKPDVVLDPTWLWDFSKDKNVIEPNDENYILVYGQDFTPDFINNIIKFAKNNNLSIIGLDCNSDKYDWCDILVHQSELDPFLWIGYFKKASYVATSTFHGLTFSLIFKKKFAFCKTDFIMVKAKKLLEELKIMEKFLNKDDANGMLTSYWDYEYIDMIIGKKIDSSIEFLTKSLEE